MESLIPAKQFKVILDQDQQDYLIDLISSGIESARKLTRARILLKADESELGPAYVDEQISEGVEVSIPTIERTRKTFAIEGFTAAITPKKPSKPPNPKFDGEKEAHLIALVCSEPPEGHARWTLRLLADKMVELEHWTSISHEAIRQVLKKKRTQTLAKKAMVYSTRSICGVRRCDERCLRYLSANPRCFKSCGLC